MNALSNAAAVTGLSPLSCDCLYPAGSGALRGYFVLQRS
jgi:hypothetical protein